MGDMELSKPPETVVYAIDPVKERALVRKLDFMIVPPVMLLYTLSFLDRVNIGNAVLYGLETDLHLSSTQYLSLIHISEPTRPY